MSELSKGWRKIKLSDIATLRTGPFGSSLHQSDYVTDGVPLINPMHIVRGQLIPSPDTTVSVDTAERLSEFRLKSSDIVIGRRGEMGRCAVVRPQAEGWLCGTGSLIIRPLHGRLSSDFLQYFLAHDKVVGYLMSASVGSTMANLNQQLLLDLDVCLPPAEEQTRIVAKLEELLSDLDAGVAELKAAQKKLQQYRQSLLKAAVEGALTASWRETQRAANTPLETGAELLERILRERRARWEEKQLAKFKEQGKTPPKDWQKKYSEPVVPDITDLPELPEGWVWASVEQLGDVQLGRQRSPDKLRGEAPTRYIRAANITESGISLDDVLSMDFSEQEKETFSLREGDVLLTEASGSAEHVGRPAIWRQTEDLYCFQNTVLRFSPQKIESRFSYFWFLAMQKLGVFRKLSGGVGINHLSAGKFSKLAFALPPLFEQTEVVRCLESQFASVSEQEAAIKLSLKQSTAQRQNILRAAFAGQLVPQDPNDEPASVLLERIRSERAAQAATKKPRGRKTKEAAA